MSDSDTPSTRFSIERLKALSDGVFAIVLTILVLELDVPQGYDFSEGGIAQFIGQIEHQLLPYIASFGLVGGYWVTHHVVLNLITTADRPFVWINLAFMLPLTLIPFVTEMRADYRGEIAVAGIYGIIQVATNLLLLAMWYYARRHLCTSPTAPRVERSVDNRMIAAVSLNIIGVIVVPVNEYLATITFLCVPLLYMRHRVVDNA